MPHFYTWEFVARSQKPPSTKEADSFDFTTRDADEAHIGLLLPAVQMAEMAPEAEDDFTAVGKDAAMQGHTLVELLEVRGPSRVDDGGVMDLRSNVEMGGDFIL